MRRIAITLRTVARKRSVGVANVGRCAEAGGATGGAASSGDVGGEAAWALRFEGWCFWTMAWAGVIWVPEATSGGRSAEGPSNIGEDSPSSGSGVRERPSESEKLFSRGMAAGGG